VLSLSFITKNFAKMKFKKIIGSLLRPFFQIFSYKKITLRNKNYNAYWEVRSSSHYNLNDYQLHRYNWLIKRIEKGSSLLDIGCGNGAIISEILNNNLISIGRIHAVDFSQNALSKITDERIVKHIIDFAITDKIISLPKCDYVFLFEVIEHISDAEDLLINSLMLSKKALFFSIPNTGYLPYRLRLLFGRFPVQWKIKPNEHLRFWTLRDLRWWLTELNLIDRSEISAYKGIPVLNFFFPNLFAAGIIVKIDKK